MKMRDVYLRNITLGIADGLVSTVGLLAGLGVSGTLRSTIILTGVIYGCVEGLAMGVGSFLSEESVEVGKRAKPFSMKPILAGFAMFASFFIAAIVPLAPYLFAVTSYALWISIIISLIALFAAGLMVGLFAHRVSRLRLFRHALKMVLLGGGAILIGVLIGEYVQLS